MELVQQWYALLSQVGATVGGPLRSIVERIDLPLPAALLLGLLGATSPCQLSTNLSAAAYVSRGGAAAHPIRDAAAYAAGKALVYTLLGAFVVGLGWEARQTLVPVATIARRFLGPLMMVIGLVLLGIVRLPDVLGPLHRVFARIIPRGGRWGGLLLGAAFAFGFCPTLFLLFFGLAIPLALRSSAGLLVPGLFALGTALPLLLYAGLLTRSPSAHPFIRRVTKAQTRVRRAAAVVLLVIGLHDSLVYWLL